MKAIKKTVSLILCAAVILGLCACGRNFEYDGSGLEESKLLSVESNSDFRYEVYEDYSVIIEYFGENKRINIPARLGGKPVKGIGDNAIGKSMLAIDIVDIPKNIVYIHPAAFKDCTTTTIYTVDSANPVYKSDDGVIYSKDGKKLLHYPSGRNETSISVNKDVEVIGGYAFANNEDVTDIKLPSDVKEIGDHSFWGCEKLYKINLPEGITKIGDYALNECQSLAELKLPSTLVSIGAHAFDYCTSIKEVVVPDSVTDIGDAAFMRCRSLSSVMLPSGLIRYGYRVFTGCSLLDEFKIAPGNTAFRVADGILYSAKGDTLVDYPYGKRVDKIQILDNIKTIRAYAFYKDDTKTDNDPDDFIVDIDFNKVESIGAYAFANRLALGAIQLPSTLKELSSTSFNKCNNLSAFRIENCKNFISLDGVLFSSDKKTLLAYPADKKNGEYTIPEGTENIGDYAFSEAKNLTDINMSSTIKNVGNYSFYKAGAITEIEFNSAIKSIGEYSFANCISMNKFIIPDNTISVIPKGAFNCCDGLFEFIIPDGVTQIGEEAFRESAYIIYIEIPTSVEKIDKYAFYDMDNLQDIAIPSSVTSFGEDIVSIYDESDPDKLVLYVDADSPAEKYAKENNIPYEILN